MASDVPSKVSESCSAGQLRGCLQASRRGVHLLPPSCWVPQGCPSLWLCGDSRVTQVLGLGGLRSFFVSNFSELLNFSGNSLSPLTEGAAKGRPDRV